MVAVALAVASCTPSGAGSVGSGGHDGSGGTGQDGSTSGTGGAIVTSSGGVGSGSGGATAGSGGVSATGGITATGGASATGGITATGGGSATGGAPSTGGAAGGGSGGSTGIGGSAGRGAAGGASSNVAGRSGTGGGGSPGTAGSTGAGPQVDRTNPKLFTLQFPANDADPKATRALGKQTGYLDTRVQPKGKLVVFLHGADDYSVCGNGALGTLVASWGFHWFAPCYLSNYGVENCGNDIEGCRMEAFEGVDHHTAVTIARPDSIEERIIRGLKQLQTLNPQGDWQYFLDGDVPRWSEIVITGHSHGASTSGVIGVHRKVFRVVMLAGPNDPGQAWLSSTPMTARDRFFGFSHTGDGQHSNHLAAFQALGLPGSPTRVDNAQPPFGDSHRLISSASVSDAHQSVAAGNISGFIEAWRYLYGGNN
ncbi:MAG TPA: hypothetical protein VHU40_13065 [Polyangia bacterium]|nr:hypothetical protein [Polyangia bacterium]